MDVLLFSRYTRIGASSRLRTQQYIPFLETSGFRIHTSCLLGDYYLKDLYAGRPKRLHRIVISFAKRLVQIRKTHLYDLLWIEKEVLPWVPFAIERVFMSGIPPIVVDIDDADFHRYDLNSNPLIRILLGDKIGRFMEKAALIIAGNSYLADYARKWCGRVEELPTVVDLDRYPTPPFPKKEEEVVAIGWIGSPATADYLKIISPVLVELSKESRFDLVLVGCDKVDLPGLNPQVFAWTENEEVELLSRLSVGIMPLHDTQWERGKCGYKLIQYMACGLPVVASAVGANVNIITHGKEGFLAKGPDDWKRFLKALISDRGLREKMGMAGRNLVERKFCTRVTAPRLRDLLLTAAGAS